MLILMFGRRCSSQMINRRPGAFTKPTAFNPATTVGWWPLLALTSQFIRRTRGTSMRCPLLLFPVFLNYVLDSLGPHLGDKPTDAGAAGLTQQHLVEELEELLGGDVGFLGNGIGSGLNGFGLILPRNQSQELVQQDVLLFIQGGETALGQDKICIIIDCPH